MPRRSRRDDGRGLAITRAVLLTAVLASAGDFMIAQSAGAETKPKVALSPEKEAKFAELLKKVGEAKRKFWAARMKQEIERVTKATGLRAENAKPLEKAAEQAIDACLGGWTSKLSEGWRQYFGEHEEEVMGFDVTAAQLEQSAQTDWFGDYTRPYEHARWQEALRGTLSAEQLAAWQKVEGEREATVAKEGAELVKRVVEQSSEQQRRSFLTKAAAITAALGLPKERAEKLDALAAGAAATTADGLRERAQRMLLAMDDAQRQQILKSRQFYLGPEKKELEMQQAAWKDGVAALLSPEEAQKIDSSREDYVAKRTVVLGRILLAQLDEKIALTARQRERLRPIVEPLVKEQKALFPDGAPENFYRIEPQYLLAAGAKAPEAEMKAILDARQWQHWQEACLAKNLRAGRVVIANRKPAPAAEAKPDPRPPEPEDLEHAFSDFFQDKTAAERNQLLAVNLLKAEDAARIAALAPEAVARLETAARGTTEEALVAWKTNTENSIRAQVRDATPENVRQRLAGMENFTYRVFGASAAPAPIWEKTVKVEMSDAQRAAWQKELDARTAFRDAAVAGLILSEFDRKIPLTAEQWPALEKLIATAVRDYSPDINMMFSSPYPYAWYLQSYSMFIPIAATPEKELKTVLSKEQWERWSGSEEIGNAMNYWENVQRNHTQRVKEKK